MSKSQRVQNAAARLIRNVPRWEHTPLYSNHYIGYRISIVSTTKCCLLTFKALNRLDHVIYLRLDLCQGKVKLYNLRTNTDTILGIPRKTLKTLGVVTPSLCNKLPRNNVICEVKNLETLKSILKTYLFEEAFLK